MKKLALIFLVVLISMFAIFTQETQGKNTMDFTIGTKIQNSCVMLNDGNKMPILGLGTWTLTGATCENAVYQAIKSGYRLIDTARYYGNEAEVGRACNKAIQENLVTREELFITTKIVPSGKNANYDSLIEESNHRLNLGYIDLILVHQHGSGEKELYSAMERSVQKGIVRSIGISNWYTKEEVQEIIKDATILPAIIQNENHIFYQNTKLQEWAKTFGCIIESYYPFGGRGNTNLSLQNQVIKEIAAAHNKTSAQVILRWHIQSGYIAIPGSKNPEHIKENANIFDFELTNEEMAKIAKLNTGSRYENW